MSNIIDFNPFRTPLHLLHKMIESCNAQWETMKRDHHVLLTNPGIQEIPPNKVYPNMHDIDMDEEEIWVVSTKDTPFLGTSGVAPCYAIGAKGQSWTGETFIGLAHINIITPNEALEGLTKELRYKGCTAESIEFYIIGGMLPFDGEVDYDHSFNKQKEFIDLRKEYNIQGARFNIVEGDDALTVIMSAEGLLWSFRRDVFSSESSDSSTDESESTEETSDSSSSSESESTSDSESSSDEQLDLKRKREDNFESHLHFRKKY